MKRSPWYWLAPLAWTLALAGCGFTLSDARHSRLNQPLHISISSVIFDRLLPAQRGFVEAKADLNRQLRAEVLAAGGTVVDDRTRAAGHLEIDNLGEGARLASLSRIGTATEFELVLGLRYRLVAANGEVLLPFQTLSLRQDYFNDEINVLGRSAEEEIIRRDLRAEAVRRILRKVASALHHAGS